MNKTKIALVCAALGALVVAAPLFALAGNVPDQVNNAGQVQVSAYVPHIESVEMHDDDNDANAGTALGSDVSGTLLDTRDGIFPTRTYGFFIVAYHNLGEANIENMDLTFYFDCGNDVTTYYDLAGANTQNVNVSIDLLLDTAVINKPVTSEIAFNPLTDVVISHGVGGVPAGNYLTVYVTFGFEEWMRWAPGDGMFDATVSDAHTRADTLNDPWSWNYVVRAYDTYSTSDVWYGEFGIFKYNAAVFNNIMVSGSGAPGRNDLVLTNGGLSPNIDFQSNSPHVVSVALTGNLAGVPAGSIDANYLSIQGGDDLASEAPFAPGGSVILVTGRPNIPTPDYRLMMNYSDDTAAYWNGIDGAEWRLTPDIVWRIDIPMSTAEGTYTQSVTYSVTTSISPVPVHVYPYGTVLP